jgi:hypothetical protein
MTTNDAEVRQMTSRTDTPQAGGGRRLLAGHPALTDDGLLRVALKLDAIVTGANGAAYVVIAGPLGDLLGVPTSFLRAIGAFLVIFAVAVWETATSDRPAPAAVLAVIALNVLWVVDSLVVLATGAYDPTTVGAVWIALQAATVAGFAGLQAAGRKRASR